MYINKLVSENVANREFLGVDKTDSETAILADLSSHPGAFPLATGDTLPAVGAAEFDTTLQGIAHADMTLAHQDFQDYLASLHSGATDLTAAAASVSDLGAVSDVSGVAGSVGDLGGLSGNLSGFSAKWSTSSKRHNRSAGALGSGASVIDRLGRSLRTGASWPPARPELVP